MLSLDLRQILPPKCHFLFAKKCKFRQKFCHNSRILPISSNVVKNQYFCHDGQFSSFRQFFVKNEILWSLCNLYHHEQFVLEYMQRHFYCNLNMSIRNLACVSVGAALMQVRLLQVMWSPKVNSCENSCAVLLQARCTFCHSSNNIVVLNDSWLFKVIDALLTHLIACLID